MLLATLAGIGALLVIVALVVAMMRHHSQKSRGVVTSKHSPTVATTIGVAPAKQKIGFGMSGHTQVAQHNSPSAGTGAKIEGRFAAMGVVAAVIFGSLSAKLFSMQVLSSSYYENASKSNLFRTVYTPAPRGIIYDAGGVPLVTNRSSYTVLANADVAADDEVVSRLSVLFGIPRQVIRQRILDTSRGAQATRVVHDDTSLRDVAFISEHSNAFAGVSCEMRTQRVYPYGALAAHVLGYVSSVSKDDIENASAGQNLQSGDIVGKSGVESYYEALLAGDHGSQTMLTDAAGHIKEVTSSSDPLRGNDIYLTIKGPVQAVAEQVMREYVAPDGILGRGFGTGAGLVCLDATNGEVVALANYPTFNPASFIGGISQDVWDEYNSADSCYPLMNRVIQSTYPAASTFKAFTSMAALNNGIANAGSTYNCTGVWTGFGKDFPQKCWLEDGHGGLDLVGGIAHSCDVVFYEIGKGFYQSSALPETAMQDSVMEYGFGSQTGIDLAGEAKGRIPTPKWKAEYFKDAPEEARWQGGDMTNMAIGQGYVLVTPLQVAVGYCAIARGQAFRPHVLREVRNSLGDTVLTVEPEVIAQPQQNATNIGLVHQGLLDVITTNNYGSFFSDIDSTVAGKTGTAEVAGKDDYSWFVCYAPADDPKYVVACVVEEGKNNKKNAIPMCAKVLTAALDYDSGDLDKTNIATFSGAYSVSINRDTPNDYESRRD